MWVASTVRNTRSASSYSFSRQLEIWGLVPKRMSVWATASIALRLKAEAVRSTVWSMNTTGSPFDRSQSSGCPTSASSKLRANPNALEYVWDGRKGSRHPTASLGTDNAGPDAISLAAHSRAAARERPAGAGRRIEGRASEGFRRPRPEAARPAAYRGMGSPVRLRVASQGRRLAFRFLPALPRPSLLSPSLPWLVGRSPDPW